MNLAMITSSVLLLVAWTTTAKVNRTQPSFQGINKSKFTRVICTIHDKDLVKTHFCKLKPINRYKSVISLSGFLTRPVYKIQAHVQMYRKYNTAYKPFLINVHENLCEVFSNKYGAPYWRIFRSMFGKYSNLNHTCPYEGEIYMRDMPMDPSKLKVLWPEGDYRLDFEVSANNGVKPAWTILMYFEMKEESVR